MIDSEPQPENGVRVVGLYGTGGSGKTTLCKALCNELSMKFHDKVYHAEFGGLSISKEQMLQKLLENLSDLDPKILPNKMDDGESLNYLSKRAKFPKRVFLVVDNVADDLQSLNLAHYLKEACFGNGSVILITARSRAVLMAIDIDESDCLEMPDLQEDEAKSLFLDNVVPASYPRNEIDELLLMRCIQRCYFNKGGNNDYHYHPCALMVLGIQLRYISHGYKPRLWNRHLNKVDDTFNLLRHGKHPLFSILRSSFDLLLHEDKLLFMDIALFLPPRGKFPLKVSVTKDGFIYVHMPERLDSMFTVSEWLGVVHGKRVDEVEDMVEGLKRKSLLVTMEGRFSMHDLWREFALSETQVVASKDRHWIYEPDKCIVLFNSENVRSVCLRFEDWKGSKTVNLKRKFPNVAVLVLKHSSSNLTLDVKGMEHLKSLEVILYPINGLRNVSLDGLHTLQNLNFLRIVNLFVAIPTGLEEIGCLINLEVLDLQKVEGADQLPLRRLTNLRILSLRDCGPLNSLNLGNLTNLTYLDVEYSEIRKLDLSGCRSLRKVWDLGKNQDLEELNLSSCHSLEELPSLKKCRNLRELRKPDCWLIQSSSGLSNLKSLRKLDITGCKSMTQLCGLSGNIALKELRATGCENLAELPNMRKLTNLQVLDIESKTVVSGKEEEKDKQGKEEEEIGYQDFYVFRKTNHIHFLPRGRCQWKK